MVSEYGSKSVGPPIIYNDAPNPVVFDLRECVQSPTSDNTWFEHMFISGCNLLETEHRLKIKEEEIEYCN